MLLLVLLLLLVLPHRQPWPSQLGCMVPRPLCAPSAVAWR